MTNSKGSSKIFWGIVLVILSFSFGVVFGKNVEIPTTSLFQSKPDVSQNMFWDVWSIMKSKYVEKGKVSDEDMMYGAIKGLVNSYDDPATIFLTPKETDEFNQANEGKYFEGIGAELGYEDGNIIVVSPIDGSPAKAAGIRSRDYILSVDDYEVKSNDNIYDIVKKIRGEAGTKVKLKILHKGESKAVDIEITRGEITVPSMTLSFIENKSIAVIDVARFTDSSYIEWTHNWDRVVNDVVNSNAKKVIIDLRGNPGGYFDAAVYSAGEFLKEGTIIAKQEDGNKKVEEFKAKKGGKLTNTEVLILVDEGSASASEIFSGALQQNDRAKILGVKTYGKGTAQSVIDLNGGASLHVTILKWLLPNGNWLNRDNPVVPDIEVENTTDDFIKGVDRQMEEAIKELKK